MNLGNKFQEWFKAISVYPTGSKYTCTPPVLDTDEDYLVLVEDFNKVYLELSESPDWEDCMPSGTEAFKDAYQDEKSYGMSWNAFRHASINIMVTGDINWYMASVAATEYCRVHNVQDKAQRIRIFRNLKYREPLLPGDLP